MRNKALERLRSIAYNADPFTRNALLGWLNTHVVEIGQQSHIDAIALEHGGLDYSEYYKKAMTHNIAKEVVRSAASVTVRQSLPFGNFQSKEPISYKEYEDTDPEAFLLPTEYGLTYTTYLAVITNKPKENL
jgi:hypothetical protein